MENHYNNLNVAKVGLLAIWARGGLLELKRNITLPFVCLSLLFLFSITARAQYTNVPVTGFNADVVADGAVGPAINSTNADVDGVNYVFVSTTFNPGSGICTATGTALPASNQLTSLITPALTYNLQPYNANNILRLVAGTTGLLTVTTPQAAANLYLLATGGSGLCNLSVTVNFTDLTTQVITTSVNDWCSGVGPASPQYYRIGNTSTTCNGGPCQYLYELNLAISGTNYGKQIASLQIQNLVGGGVLNVFALGAKAVCALPTDQATSLVSGTITTGSIAASFTDAATIPTGGYLVVRYPQGGTPTAPAAGTLYTAGQALGTGTVVSSSATTSFTASGLSGNTSYDFYVYSYNSGTTCGGPVYLTTTPLTATFATSVCGTVNGTIIVGPGGYNSISTAIAALNTSGINGNVIIELDQSYDGTTANEVFPITFPYNACVNAARTITIRPASTVSSVITIICDSFQTINVNGGSYITIDGRPGGSASASMLKIVNTKATGTAIQFINDAHHNTVKYCDIQGQNTSATSAALAGVIYFAGTTTPALAGNDYNTIANCDIHATSGGFPAIAVYSYGNNVTTPVSSWNDSNTITDCNIYDFYSATLSSTAVKLEGGSNGSTIKNNHIYQTATRNYTVNNQHRAFWLTPGTIGACGYQVINNFIGGDNSTGTGTWTLTSNATIQTNFWGMDINHSGLARTSVQGNTITNISLASNTTTANDLFRGISTGGTGNVDIGNITGNTIGAETGTGAILINTTGTGSTSYGIKVGSTIDTINVYNNKIGGITLSSATAANALNFQGIGITSSAYTNIVGNTIGSLITPLSINSIDSATNVQSVHGISVASGTYTTVNNNKIANINNNYKSTSTGYTRGIYLTSSTTSVITGNIVSNLSTASIYTGSGTLAALVGIQMSSSNPSTVSRNIVDSLVLASASIGIASSVEGIVFSSNGSTPVNLVTRNFVHSLDVSAVNTSAIMIGIEIVGGSNIVANNIIRLGVKPDGTPNSTSMIMRGLYINTTTAENIYHNSVYIGGTNVGTGTINTAAFYRNTSTAGNQHDVRNNIFMNERSNATTGGKHYQIYLNNITALSISNNNYFGSTLPGSVFGTLNGGGADVLSYTSGWLGTDLGSSISNPRFINPTGSAATIDMHIDASTPTPVESTGLLLSSITDDYDGQLRSSSTPVDVGADGGTFTPLPMSVDSTVLDQNTNLIPKGSTNQYITRIRVYAKDNYTPLQISSFVLNTSATTNAADIVNAKVFSTGTSGTFSTASQYGTTRATPSGAFSINGTAALTSGINYFWITYDVSASAGSGNNIDVRLDNIVLTGGASAAILNGDPIGSRTIKSPLSGPYSIGASGADYPTIASAISDLTSLGVNGPVTFNLIDPLYTLTDSISVAPFPGASATNTVTLMPALANSAGAIITSSSNTSTIEMNGVSYFIIDGRPGGSASPIAVPNTTNLNIINTSLSGSAIRLFNDARNNTVKYCDLQGANNVNATLLGTSAGVVYFGSTTGSNGNDNNTIDNCNIHSTVNTAVLTMGIYSSGPSASSSLIGAFNDNNTVSNCNIYDTYGGVNLSTGGIVLDRGNNAWTITGNSFFQTATRTPVLTASVSNRGLYIIPTNTTAVGNGFTITGNYFGGTQPLCGGVTPMTSNSTGAFNNLHQGIYISVSGGAASNIKGNTFTNLNISQAASTGDLYHAIWTNHNGNINIGGPSPADGNVVGSSTTNGAITLASGGATITPSHMIILAGTANSATNILIQNNKIGGITLTGNGNAFTGIYLGGGSTVIVDHNLIGSTTVPNSINASNAGTVAAFVRGINVPATANVITITNNTIANLNNNNTSTTGGTNGVNSNISQTNGIYLIGTSTVGPIVTGNIIKDLSCASAIISTGTAACVTGIAVSNTTAITPAIISSNIVDSLVSTATSTTAAISPVGIVYNGPIVAVNTVSKNAVNNIDVSAINTGALIKGIELTAGAINVLNNIVRLGVHADGTDLSTSLAITGILKSGTGNNKFYHNSVYIGGSNIGVTVKNTSAFQRTSTGVDDIRNNIFVNNRSNGTTGGKHYQLMVNNTTTLTVNYNLYNGTGLGTVFGSLNGGTSDVSLYSAGWLASDINSIVGDPEFNSATGPSATADLHIHATNPTPVESTGTFISLVTDDYDGQPRSSNTPVDIGADGGNFVQKDLVGPTIGAFLAGNTSSMANRNILITLSDNSGVATGGSAPRIYYYKSSGGVIGGTSSSAATLTSGTVFNGQWTFTVASADMSGLSLNDSVYYYIAAQDASAGTYTSSSPAGATNFGVTPPPTLYSYKIVQGYAGSIPVGVGQTFTSLTAVGGIFDSINKGSLSGDVTLSIVSDLLLEDGAVALTQWSESSSSPTYKVTIAPSAATERLIAGNVSVVGSGLIKLDGADRVKIDGRFAGSGRYLRFRNRAQAGTTISLLNDAHNDTITYCYIEGTNNTSGVINFGTTNVSNGTGNDSNSINNCFIGDTLGSAGTSNRPSAVIYSNGTANFENSENSIVNNNIYNYISNGINVTATGNGSNWNITGNSFYNNMSPPPSIAGPTTINFIPGVFSVNNRINGNYIGGAAPLCAGAAFGHTGNMTWKAISVNAGTSDSNYIQSNTIQNINLTGTGAGSVTMIELLGGLASISGNTIGHNTTANSIQTPLLGTIIGIFINGTTDIVQIYDNLIGNITSTGTTTAIGVNGIRITNANTNFPLGIRGNVIKNITGATPTVSTSTSAMIGILSTYGGLQQNISNNMIFNLLNSGVAATAVVGINISSTVAAGVIGSNLIYGLNNTVNNNTAQIVGIHLDAAYMFTVVNNMVSLGYNVDSSSIISGIMDKSAGTLNQIFYNTVLISGVNTIANAGASQAYRRTTTSGTNVRNNIFNNTRTGGTANYATANTNATPGTGWTANYNVFSAVNASQIGFWSFAPTTLASWKSNSIFDTNSVSYAANFVTNTDLHLGTGSIGNGIMAGSPIAGFTTDFDGQVRSTSFPYIGADEKLVPVPVKLIEFAATVRSNDVLVTWATASESNNKTFEIERSLNGHAFELIGSVNGKGNSSIKTSYELTDAKAFAKTNSTVLYYRLKQVDRDGKFSYSNIATVSLKNGKESINVYPNPFSSSFEVTFTTQAVTKATVTVTNIAGKTVHNEIIDAVNGSNTKAINLDAMQTGMYFVTIDVNGEKKVVKVLKY
jgi:hypothetical protein